MALRTDLVNADEVLRAAASTISADANATTNSVIWTASVGEGYNGSTVDRLRVASAANLSATPQAGVSLVALAGQWSILHAPAANTQATASKAAGAAGVRHVCTAFAAVLYSGSTAITVPATPVTVTIRDGATGAGTIIWQEGLSAITTAGSSFRVAQTGLSLVGTAATAMTIEFSAAGGAGSFETVSLQGYSVA